MNNTLTIAYTITNDSLYYAIVSIASLFINNKDNNINLNIIYDENLDDEYLKLFKKFDIYKNCTELNYIKINSSKYDYFKRNLFFSERFYIFELPNLINADRVLYINEYTIVNSDLEELYNTDLENYSCAAVEYIYGDEIKDISDFGYQNNIMVIDCKKFRNENFYEKFINYVSKYNKEEKLNDLILFNSLIPVKKLDYKWNYGEDWYRKNKKLACSDETQNQYKNFLSHIETPGIITFIGPKPIGSEPCNNSYTSLWWKYAEQTPIYKDIKEFRQLNKYK